jgi:hypothetical protein
MQQAYITLLCTLVFEDTFMAITVSIDTQGLWLQDVFVYISFSSVHTTATLNQFTCCAK